MRLFTSQRPRNHWHWIRHGQSMANVQQIIASDPATAVDGFGLSEAGRQQVRHTLSKQAALNSATRIVSSDFMRAHQTAQIARDVLQCSHPINLDIRLRERFFGVWEATSSDNYDAVWTHDASDQDHTIDRVESVTSVAERLCELVIALDSQFEQQVILLVSHGDPLQILECCITHRPLTEHRLLPPLATAEHRSFEQVQVRVG